MHTETNKTHKQIQTKLGLPPKKRFSLLLSLVARLKALPPYVTPRGVTPSFRTSLGSNFSFNFLSVGLVLYAFSNFSPSGLYKVSLMCHHPSPSLGGFFQFHSSSSSSLFYLFIPRFIGKVPWNSTIFLKTRGSSNGSSSISLANSCSTE